MPVVEHQGVEFQDGVPDRRQVAAEYGPGSSQPRRGLELRDVPEDLGARVDQDPIVSVHRVNERPGNLLAHAFHRDALVEGHLQRLSRLDGEIDRRRGFGRLSPRPLDKPECQDDR